MNDIFLELPFPPSINNIYGKGKNNIYLKKHAKEYKKIVKNIIQAYIRKNNIEKINQPLIFYGVAYEPDRRIRDQDNIKKILFDAITFSKLWSDDKLVREEHFYLERNNHIKGKVFIKLSPKY